MNADNTPQSDPEQLLKMLDAQIAAARAFRRKRKTGPAKTGTMVMVLIVFGAMGALWMLMTMLEEMRAQRPGQPSAGAESR